MRSPGSSEPSHNPFSIHNPWRRRVTAPARAHSRELEHRRTFRENRRTRAGLRGLLLLRCRILRGTLPRLRAFFFLVLVPWLESWRRERRRRGVTSSERQRETRDGLRLARGGAQVPAVPHHVDLLGTARALIADSLRGYAREQVESRPLGRPAIVPAHL